VSTATESDGETALDAAQKRVSRPLLRLFRSYGRLEWRWLALGLVTSALAYGSVLVTPIVLGTTIDAVFTVESAYRLPLVPTAWLPAEPAGQFWLSVAIVGVALGGGAVLQWVRGVAMNYFAHGVMYAIRTDAYERMQRLDMAFFDSGWSRDEFDDIEEQVGPFFANRFSRAHADPPEGECRDAYQFYSVWELAETFSKVYQVQNRGEKLRSVREEMVSTISEQLPPASERPTVALVVFNPEEKTFGTYEINGPGFSKAHYRPLEPVGAFADSDKTYANNYSAIDLEQMLEVDPDVIVHHWDIEPSERYEALLALEDDPVGKKLSAIQNDRVYVGGTPMQGPIFNLFQLETAAQQIYPDVFGEFQGVGETPEDNRLFDRQRVADIVNGDS